MTYPYLQQVARAVDHLGFSGALLATGTHGSRNIAAWYAQKQIIRTEPDVQRFVVDLSR